MKIHSVSDIRHDRDKVFLTYRDQLPEVARYMPDIREILELSREQRGAQVQVHNEWVAQREIPRAMRMLFKPEHVRWDDYARWDGDEYVCHWEIKPRVLREKVRCAGVNRFTDLGGSTRLCLEGELLIELDRIPGLPRIMARKLGPQVERFIVSLITPNLERVNGSLERYLDERG